MIKFPIFVSQKNMKLQIMKKILLIAAILIGSIQANAQSYNWGIGVRGGLSTAEISVKHPLSTNALEATLGVAWNQGFRMSALYEWTIPVITDGFTFYYGLGANFGGYSHSSTSQTESGSSVIETKTGFLIGAGGVAGLEYEIPVIPISAFFDYRPSLNIGDGVKFDFRNVALGLRFCF